jgi:hypothetical protein
MTPDLSRMMMGVLRGGPEMERVIEPYVRSASAPYQAGIKQAADQVLRTTPAGGRQSAMLADVYTKGALARSQDISQQRQQWIQNIMQMLQGIYGQPVQPIGSTATQKPGLSFGLGPIQGTL